MPGSSCFSVTGTVRADIAVIVEEPPNLRRGWTTGACATAAAKAAWVALQTGHFPDPVCITLPGGADVAFSLAETQLDSDHATAAVVKDAGDDPDVTHGALIRATVSRAAPGSGVCFRAGDGVGTITLPGLALPPGEPAINPVPRQMIRQALANADAVVTISIPNGAALATRTLNARLGVMGGLSVLGTTGIVVPFSCAAWISSIHRGIDVARAANQPHLAGATGNTSERAVQKLHHLPDMALIEMGDFVGGMLKYLRAHPVPRLTLAGGVAKITKLAQGRLDLHSKRGMTDMPALAALTPEPLAGRIAASNTVAEAFTHAAAMDFPLGDTVAARAWSVAAELLRGADITLDIAVFDREGGLVGLVPPTPVHDPSPRKRLR